MELSEYIDLNKEQLLLAMVPDDERIVYSKQGMLARGIELFNSYFDESRDVLCNVYRKRKTEFNSLIDAANIVLTVLTAHSQLSSAIIVPFSVLVAKYGLEKLCSETPNS